MEKEKILETLIRRVYDMKGEEKDCSFNEVASQLYERGSMLSIADEDCTLGSLISTDGFKEYLTVREDSSGNIRISLTDKGEEKAIELNEARYSNPESLFTWAFMGKLEDTIGQLAEIALPEVWDDGKTRYGILSAYIINTFKRLLHESRKEHRELAIVEQEKWAAFNTGLVDRLYDPIYALFSRNRMQDKQKWKFHSWCTPGNKRSGQILSRSFELLPRKASYFSQPSELIYDMNAGMPTLPFDHILDRLMRLPVYFLKRFAPDGIVVPDTETELTQEFCERYKEALLNEGDGLLCLHFKDALELSLARAVKRVAWNYRLAIPIYDAKRRKLMLLIPLSLDSRQDKVDIALVVERAKNSGKYIGHTILTLGMAYKKARMIMRPEGDWLFEKDNRIDRLGFIDDEDDITLNEDIADNEAEAMAASKANELKAEKNEKEEIGISDPFLYQHEQDEVYRPEEEYAGLKILGSINPDLLEKGKRPREIEDIIDSQEINNKYLTEYDKRGYWRPEDGEVDIRGVFYEGYNNKPYIMVGKSKFEAREFTDDGIIDDDDVIFDIASEANKHKEKEGRNFYYAVNIRIDDD